MSNTASSAAAPTALPAQRTARSSAPVLEPIVQQHAEEAALLRHLRSVLVRAPHVSLGLLSRHDARLEAHLDGLAVAGDSGVLHCREALDAGDASAAFALGVLSLRQRAEPQLDQLIDRALAAPAPQGMRALGSAFGWVSADCLQGVVRRLLADPRPEARALALAACRMHRVDPGPALAAALSHSASPVRAAALRTAGALGRVDLIGAIRATIGDGEPRVVLTAAWAACRLGERQAALKVLATAAQQEGDMALPALATLMLASPPAEAQEFARHVSAVARSQPSMPNQRRLLHAIGLLGDPRHVPWLIERMAEPALARAAGEAFSMITGADLAALQLERLDAGAESTAPTEVPAEDDLAVDPDESLPWPDPAAVQRWWEQSAGTAASGGRLFVGRECTPGGALAVLREGSQRQRAHASLLLGLLQPREPMFPVAAPAWRQRRWLAPAQ